MKTEQNCHYPQMLHIIVGPIKMEISSCLLALPPHILYILHYSMYLHTGQWAYAEMK